MPSINTRTWLPSVPRTRTCVWPAMRLTATPGTSRSKSDIVRVCRSASALASINVTEPPTWLAGRATLDRVPVTTIVPSSASTGAGSSANAAAAILKRVTENSPQT